MKTKIFLLVLFIIDLVACAGQKAPPPDAVIHSVADIADPPIGLSVREMRKILADADSIEGCSLYEVKLISRIKEQLHAAEDFSSLLPPIDKLERINKLEHIEKGGAPQRYFWVRVYQQANTYQQMSCDERSINLKKLTKKIPPENLMPAVCAYLIVDYFISTRYPGIYGSCDRPWVIE